MGVYRGLAQMEELPTVPELGMETASILPDEVYPGESALSLGDDSPSAVVSNTEALPEFVVPTWQKVLTVIVMGVLPILILMSAIAAAWCLYMLPMYLKYGIVGSYESPNVIFVNIKKFYNEGLLRIIIHESIHLLINSYILNYKTDHWSKERIVDLIFLDLFPELSKMQVIPDTEALDELFYEYFPNIEKVIFEISKLKKQKCLLFD